jgi:pentatricopeptide repeat protein
LYNFPLSTATSTILLTSLFNLSNSPESAYSAFLSIKNPDAIAFGALIAVLCKAEHVEEALGVFDLMLERGLQPTARTCTCILKAYCMEGKVREAQIFIQAIENGTGNRLLPRPDVIMYTVYIEGLCLVRDFDSVEQVFTSCYCISAKEIREFSVLSSKT